jgi:hypothetical protein
MAGLPPPRLLKRKRGAHPNRESAAHCECLPTPTGDARDSLETLLAADDFAKDNQA